MASTKPAQASSREGTTPRDIFQKVCTTFRSSLTEDERRAFEAYPDSSSMLESVKRIYEKHPLRDSRLGRLLQKLGGLADLLTPYFEVVNMFVQSHPEYAALVWGALRFLFTIGAHYTGFIEKLSKVFEKVAFSLPSVEIYISLLESRSRKRGQQLSSRLAMALACVYADLVGFCQDIHVLFAGRRGSRFRTVTILKDLCWQPFDTRFNTFLRSFDQHAMSLSLELKLDHASNVLKEFELLQEKLSQMEQNMKALQPDVSSVKQSRRQQEEEENTNNSIRRLLRWIRPPGWQQSFDDANRRFPGTCGWLLDEPCYKAWEQEDLESSNNRRLLLVQGKPGYGKTYLCASLVERLKYSLQTSKKTSSQVMEFRLLFYFYDKRQPQSCQSICGFRAVLAQLLQANKHDREILDLACFAMGESVYPDAEANLEELKATDDETLSLIQIILQRSEGVTLVFDGVDECSDTQNFFESLAKATDCIPCPRDEPAHQYCSQVNQQSPKTANIKVALFCRPDLHVPRVLFERASRIQLASRHNETDIEAFIHHSLQGLVDDALLSYHIDLRSVSASVSSRANGMFLWARLLIEYLRCDAFTPQDRMEALLSLNNFEGLDRLYGAILQKLHQRLPANGRLTVHKAFAWVAGAFRPLLIDEFKVAIAIVSGRNTSSGDTISNIEQALIRMSGALLELAADHTVRFIHPSVREYICESSLDRHISSCVHFRLNNIQVQLQLADLCLVYILEQLPPGPLSGSSQLTPDRAQIITAYPFLQYSIAFWTRHCATGLCSTSDETGVPEISGFVGSLKRIEDLILSKERVATWFEASWLFGVRPQLEALVSSFGQLLSEAKSLDVKRLEKITATLWLLSMDIQQLRKDWDLVLSETPNEIWNPSISSHAPSDFWPKAPGATWKSLRGAANQQDKAILVESHTFEDSMELGLVKILVPRHILALPQQDSRCTSGWRASYEIWSLSTSQVRFRIFLEIDPVKVQGLISTGHIGHIEDEVPRLRELEFQFPVVFGDSSRHLLILDYLIYVEEMLESQSSPDPQKNCRFSIVDLTKGSPGVLSQERGCSLTENVCSASSRTCTTMIPAQRGAMKVVQPDLPAVQKSNNLVITRNEDGLRQASLLQQSSTSVVLQTVVEDGTAQQALLSKVPSELRSNQPVLLRGGFQGHNTDDLIRIAWIKPPQAWYSFDEIVREENPLLCERTQATIPKTSTEIQLRVRDRSSDTKRKIASVVERSDMKKRRIEGSCENSERYTS